MARQSGMPLLGCTDTWTTWKYNAFGSCYRMDWGEANNKHLTARAVTALHSPLKRCTIRHTASMSKMFLFLQHACAHTHTHTHTRTHTHTHPFNGPLSGSTRVSRYQKGKTNLDFTGARDSEWQWHQLGDRQVCTSLQIDNHTSTSLLKFFYRPDAIPAAQPTVSKHWRHFYFFSNEI